MKPLDVTIVVKLTPLTKEMLTAIDVLLSCAHKTHIAYGLTLLPDRGNCNL